jgi:hypothetical protein
LDVSQWGDFCLWPSFLPARGEEGLQVLLVNHDLAAAALRLRGTKSNRDAIGAVVRLHICEEILTRHVDPAGGYLAQSSRTLRFGLGDRTKIDRVEIDWPSGVHQDIACPALNRLHTLVESEQ